MPEPSTPAIARGDEAKLRQVVLAVVDNAADATSSGGSIAIETELRGDRAVLAIVDDGPGFDAGAKAHLFEPFFTTKPHGTGLGLALAQTTIEAHHGELRVDSGRRGARIEIVLPAGHR